MRQIYIVNATQVVTSENHPEGLYGVYSGYPKNFDSRNYNATEQNPDGDVEKAYRMAKADFLLRQSDFLSADNPNRAMWAVTLTRADGRQMMDESLGEFPNVTPQPEPEPEPEEVTE